MPVLRYASAKNYQNGAWFDKVIAKIKWCGFLTHIVDRKEVDGWCLPAGMIM